MAAFPSFQNGVKLSGHVFSQSRIFISQEATYKNKKKLVLAIYTVIYLYYYLININISNIVLTWKGMHGHISNNFFLSL